MTKLGDPTFCWGHCAFWRGGEGFGVGCIWVECGRGAGGRGGILEGYGRGACGIVGGACGRGGMLEEYRRGAGGRGGMLEEYRRGAGGRVGCWR